MRKAIVYLLAASLAPTLLAGCAGDDRGPDAASGKTTPEFSASIGAQSRAFDRQWEAGDEIGITGAGRANVCYLTDDGTSRFGVKTHGDEIYFQNEDEATFTAYYPWSSLSEGMESVSADTRLQSLQKSFDFLWATASGSKAQPGVAFVFSHRMAKLSLTVKADDGVTYDEVKNCRYSLGGLRHSGSLNVADGTVGATGTPAGDWVFSGSAEESHNAPATYAEESRTVTFPLILFPQHFDEPLYFSASIPGMQTFTARIDFTAANIAKDGADAKNELKAGLQYNLSVTLHKTGVSMYDCTINAWEEVEGGNINAEQ